METMLEVYNRKSKGGTTVKDIVSDAINTMNTVYGDKSVELVLAITLKKLEEANNHVANNHNDSTRRGTNCPSRQLV